MNLDFLSMAAKDAALIGFSFFAVMSFMLWQLNRRTLDRYRIKYGFDSEIEKLKYEGKKQWSDKDVESTKKSFEKRKDKIRL